LSGERFAAGLLDGVDGMFQWLGSSAAGDDFRSLSRQRNRDSLTDTGTTASDDGGPSIKSVHRRPTRFLSECVPLAAQVPLVEGGSAGTVHIHLLCVLLKG
jgi:hypothetical protein